MSAEKRALDDLDALFLDVPDDVVLNLQPSKKLRHGQDNPSQRQPQREGPATSASSAADKHKILYKCISRDFLPSRQGRESRGSKAGGASPAERLTEFVRGVSGRRGQQAADSMINSRIQKKVVHLSNASVQQEVQSARARAARSAGNVRMGLSGKQCKRKGLNEAKARDGGQVSFRDLLGLHTLWKGYASRLVSEGRSNQKSLQQRILAADLQGSYLTVSRASTSSLVNAAGIVVRETANTFKIVTADGKTKTVPKKGCAFRLAFGGHVVNLAGRALEGRQGGKAGLGQTRSMTTAKADEKAGFLPTTAL